MTFKYKLTEHRINLEIKTKIKWNNDIGTVGSNNCSNIIPCFWLLSLNYMISKDEFNFLDYLCIFKIFKSLIINLLRYLISLLCSVKIKYFIILINYCFIFITLAFVCIIHLIYFTFIYKIFDSFIVYNFKCY